MQWEYAIVGINFGTIYQQVEVLNEHGENGWELVSVMYPPGVGRDINFYFKREKRSPLSDVADLVDESSKTN